MSSDESRLVALIVALISGVIFAIALLKFIDSTRYDVQRFEAVKLCISSYHLDCAQIQ